MKATYPLMAAAALALAACAMPPEDVTEEDLANFDAAVASVGCTLRDERQYQPVELQTGLPRNKVIEIAAYRIDTEDAVRLDEGGVRLLTGSCAPTAQPAEPEAEVPEA
ncbi:hypothetical protein [Allosediminivita pacifica]|uniref:Uncharacterized protein n=1 Tax=Allosediminivita pacifica TaxID=1267769 RepID=A0A2T6B2A5_9RHOB|nr:hypothetical protein [Allosediminivita pacifica]PTX50208.1 hypothetical protein C8N44_10568 [Allosediminivita pacifica]GGB02319.1 hypothetical protein GCM10011324_10640 [Allosediminivita pacifica]